MRRFRRGPSVERVVEGHEPDNAAGRLIDDRLGQVEAELMTAARGASLCSISKVAGSVPAAKYLEGRVAALLQLRRQAGTVEEARAALDHVSAEWESELERVTDGDFGSDWLAYRAGGVDELREMEMRLPTA